MPVITLTVNGQRRSVDVPPDTPLLWVLRDELKLKGTKYSCGMAECGACTVLLEGKAIRSCSTSIVVTERLAALATDVLHERTALPSSRTVQAPHSAIPHEYFVPFSFRSSRSTQSSGVSGGASTLRRSPLTVSVITGMQRLLDVSGGPGGRSVDRRRRDPRVAGTGYPPGQRRSGE